MQIKSIVLAALIALTACAKQCIAPILPPVASWVGDLHRKPTNHIRFRAPVNDESVDAVIKAMNEVRKLGFQYIILEIDSHGGSVPAGMKLSRHIEEIGVPVFCLVNGEADSMAFFVLQTCPVRLMTKESRIMLHQAYLPSIEKSTEDDLDNYKADLHTMNNQMVAHFVKHMNLPEAVIRQHIEHGKNWWMSPADALKYHAVDRVTSDVAEAITYLTDSVK